MDQSQDGRSKNQYRKEKYPLHGCAPPTLLDPSQFILRGDLSKAATFSDFENDRWRQVIDTNFLRTASSHLIGDTAFHNRIHW